MKKSLRVLVGLLFLSSVALSQVLEKFETAGSTGMYMQNNWGSPGTIDSIYQTADPSGKSTGVLAVALNLTGVDDKDALGLKDPGFKGQVSSGLAHFITVNVYIPNDSNIPDSLGLQLYYQPSQSGWTWTATDYLAKDIPKGVWYPLSMNILQLSISDPTGHGINGTNDVGDFGLQIYTAGDSKTTVWKGTVYIDNVELIGKKPTILGDFKTSLAGPNGSTFSNQWHNGWADSIYWSSTPVGDSTGVMVCELKDGSASTGGTSFGNQPDPGGFAANGQNFLVQWVYVDTTFPDTFHIQTWAQSDPSWNWPPNGPLDYLGSSIKRGKWYPLYFDLAQASLRDTVSGSYFNTFNNPTQNLRKYGIQIYGEAGVDWKGKVVVDNVAVLNSVVDIPLPPAVWTAANFDSVKYGVQGFYVPSYAGGTIRRYLETSTNRPGYVMQGSLDISSTAPKFGVVRDSIPMQNAAGDSIAISVGISVYIPAQMPKNGVVKFFVTDGTDSIAVTDTIGKTIGTVWRDMKINKLDSLAQAGDFDPTKPCKVGVVIYYPAPYDTTKWTGKVDFDDLKITGFMGEGQLVTGIKKLENVVVGTYELYQNYPNPFNPTTKIKYDVAKNSKVMLRVYDILGREVATLVNEQLSAGSYEVDFNASKFATGVYLFKMEAGSFVKTHKMMLVK